MTERAKLCETSTSTLTSTSTPLCRIAGIIDKNQSNEILKHQVSLMCDSMQHGGPDGFGIYNYAEHHVCLGNRRLAIIDLSEKGNQPMQNSENNLVITFNGEIYNYLALKKELQAIGYPFKTKTDTEVILHAYKHWGENAFEKLNGIFAFCLFDTEKKLTFLVRDALGVKPLYYHHEKGAITFASEVKAFEAANINETDENWKIYFLAFGHIPEPYTTLKNVQALAKGHYLKYDLNSGTSKTIPFFQFDEKIYITDEESAIILIRKALNTAVERQINADTDVGVLFSGGLDSSIIALLAQKNKTERLSCIAANFNELDFSEYKQRTLLSKQINLKQIEALITYRDFVHNFDSILANMDQPSNDGINTWFVCKAAKNHGLKVLLSGLGADELFGGYPSFDRIHKIQNLSWLSKSTLRSARFLKEIKLKRLYYLSLDSPIGEYLCLRGVFSPDTIASLLDIDQKTVVNCLENFPINPAIKKLNNEHRASWFEFNIYMQNQLLKDTDFMSMSHGVEIRVPFLDREFVSLVETISTEIRFDLTQKKRILIEAYKDELPRATWDRSKMGFTFPFQEWMRKSNAISDPDLYKNKKAKALMTNFKNNRLHWSSAFALYRLYHAS